MQIKGSSDDGCSVLGVTFNPISSHLIKKINHAGQVTGTKGGNRGNEERAERRTGMSASVSARSHLNGQEWRWPVFGWASMSSFCFISRPATLWEVTRPPRGCLGQIICTKLTTRWTDNKSQTYGFIDVSEEAAAATLSNILSTSDSSNPPPVLVSWKLTNVCWHPVLILDLNFTFIDSVARPNSWTSSSELVWNSVKLAKSKIRMSVADYTKDAASLKCIYSPTQPENCDAAWKEDMKN